MTNEGGAGQVECRLSIGGVEYRFTLEGPLVAMAPASEKMGKKATKKGAKRDGR
jgi:hypothetical protein